MTRRLQFVLVSTLCFAQRLPVAAPIPWKAPVEEKNFYLLSLIDRTAGPRRSVRDDPVLARIARERQSALESAVTKCATQIDCYANALKWSDSDIAEIAAALKKTARSLAATLRSSGLYVRYNSLDDAELIAKAWTDCATGINHVIDVYGLGVAPRYPAIDSATYDVKTPAGARMVANLVAVLDDDRASLDLFFLPSIRFALGLMDLNLRDEAGRLEPMEKGENTAAYRAIRSTDWKRFPYTVIVVPGAGNDRPGVRLSPGGKLRVQLAAKRYRDGKAPFILVSGGFVHPIQTPYAEAIEMKRELMEKYAIPESAILIDPHARHTTTNIRNAARIMFRYGMPFDSTALITTDPGQSASIENPEFEKRCLRELGYTPLTVLRRISAFDLEFRAEIASLYADPQDPLDP